MTEYIQVLTTVGSREEADRIARSLVEKRLAACVQVFGPMTSHYRWQGEIESAEEYLCLAKGRSGAFAAIAAAIREIHGYEVPEIIALPIVAGVGDYLAWMDEELAGG